MATHSSTLAWKIPWMEEPGRLQSMGSWRVRHDWATSLSLFTFMHWRKRHYFSIFCTFVVEVKIDREIWTLVLHLTMAFLAWRIPGTGETGGLSMGLHRVGHYWSDLAAAAASSLMHDRYYIDFLVVLLNNIVISTYLWNHMETLGWFGMKDIDLVCIMRYG